MSWRNAFGERMGEDEEYQPFQYDPPQAKSLETEVLNCGCTVKKGWRCPLHDAP
jgi:hypothetical protein